MPIFRSMRVILLIAVLAAIPVAVSFSQGAQKVFNETHNRYYDSLKSTPYKYALPFLGKQAYSRGYDLPLAFGMSTVYFTQRQEITIDQTLIGFNGSEKVDVSDYIIFAPTIANTNAYTIRPDIWVLPFLNLYAIIGGGTTETSVSLIEPVGIQTSQRFRAQSFGLGATLTGAVGPVWLAWDNNYNFADIDVVVEPVPAFNSSFRLGYSVGFDKHPQRTLSVWAGVFYQSIKNDTEGSIPLTDIFPNAGSGNTIDRLREWSETLPPPQRLIVNQIINKLEDIANGLDPDNSTIDYRLDKRVTGPFNLILGAQYQFNKHWMLRTEMGVFGKRSQFMLNVNYRFNLF